MVDFASFKSASLKKAEVEAKRNSVEVNGFALRQPNKGTEYFRANSDIMLPSIYLYQHGEFPNQVLYAVHPSYEHEVLEGIAAPHDIYYCTNKEGVQFAWAIKTNDNSYNSSARECVSQAYDSWISIKSNRATKEYTSRQAATQKTAPVFSFDTDEEFFKATFPDASIIQDDTHKVIKELLGE